MKAFEIWKRGGREVCQEVFAASSVDEALDRFEGFCRGYDPEDFPGDSCLLLGDDSHYIAYYPASMPDTGRAKIAYI